MDADWQPTSIPGALRSRLRPVTDGRGSFQELWRASWTAPHVTRPFVQANLSRSVVGALRGLHFHLHQADLWTVLAGRAHVVLVDVRSRIDGREDQSRVLQLEMGAADSLLIPPGAAHGFWALEPLDLLYLTSNEYDGSDEYTIAWNDPALGLSWPGMEPLLSERDARGQSIAEAVVRARDYRQAGFDSDSRRPYSRS